MRIGIIAASVALAITLSGGVVSGAEGGNFNAGALQTASIEKIRKAAEELEPWKRDARRQIADELARRYAEDPGAIRTDTVEWFRAFTKAGDFLPANLQHELLEVTRRAVLSQRPADRFSSGEATTHAITAVAHMGRRREAGRLAARWVCDGADLGALRPPELRLVCWLCCTWTAGEEGSEARRKLMSHLLQRYLNCPGQVPSLETLYLRKFTQFLFLRNSRDIRMRHEWGRAIEETYIAGAGIGQYDSTGAQDILSALSYLKSSRRYRYALNWLNAQDELGEDAVGRVAMIARHARVVDPDATRDALSAAEDRWAERWHAGKVNAAQCRRLAITWQLLGNRAYMLEWAHRAIEAAVGAARHRPDLTPEELRKSINLAKRFGILAPMRAKLAEGLYALAEKGWFDDLDIRDPALLSRLMAREEGLTRLTELMSGARDQPRLGLSRVGSLAARRLGWDAYSEWCKHAEEQAASALTADAKAGWLIVRAYAAAVRNSGEEVLIAGKPWLERALDANPSPEMRWAVVGVLVRAYQRAGHLDQSLKLLSLEEQLQAGTEVEGGMKTLRSRCLHSKRRQDGALTLSERSSDENRRSYLQRCLYRAERVADQERVKRLRQMLKAIEH